MHEYYENKIYDYKIKELKNLLSYGNKNLKKLGLDLTLTIQ
jgi:hypothetical protein